MDHIQGILVNTLSLQFQRYPGVWSTASARVCLTPPQHLRINPFVCPPIRSLLHSALSLSILAAAIKDDRNNTLNGLCEFLYRPSLNGGDVFVHGRLWMWRCIMCSRVRASQFLCYSCTDQPQHPNQEWGTMIILLQCSILMGKSMLVWHIPSPKHYQVHVPMATPPCSRKMCSTTHIKQLVNVCDIEPKALTCPLKSPNPNPFEHLWEEVTQQRPTLPLHGIDWILHDVTQWFVSPLFCVTSAAILGGWFWKLHILMRREDWLRNHGSCRLTCWLEALFAMLSISIISIC